MLKKAINSFLSEFVLKKTSKEIIIMKKFKKSEFAIYAISLMLVAAGYFNYTTFETKTEETYSEDVQDIDTEYANVGDAVLVSSNETQETNENTTNTEANTEAIETASTSETNTQNTETADTQNTNADVTDYYANSKLERDKMYAEMITNYENILNNTNASEAQKSIATQEIQKVNNTKNAIMICENLILTKGFNNCVIFINEESVNVVVNVNDGLTTDKVAKVQNVISRELGTQIENIHITEK